MSAAATLPELPTIGDFDLILEVVTHKDLRPTTADEPREWGDNQRLAELGSQVLNNAVTVHIFSRRPLVRAEEIRTWREHYTAANTLDGWLDEYQLKQKLRVPPNQGAIILNDVEQMASYFHSYVGALYLTKGQAVIQNWIGMLIDRDNTTTTTTTNINAGPPSTGTNYNTQNSNFQAQASSSSSSTSTNSNNNNTTSTSGPGWSTASPLPVSVTTSLINHVAAQRNMSIAYSPSQDGPSHLPTWTVRCSINGVERGVGVGQNQKAAREDAARKAWVAMGW